MHEPSTTSVGYTNRNRQRVIRATDLPGTDHGQRIYILRCEYSGSEYGANGSDIFQMTVNGKRVNRVRHGKNFEAVLRRLGNERAGAVCDEMKPDPQTSLRTFSSSFLGLTPRKSSLKSLYDVAREILGPSAEEDGQDRAALIFGLFVWECIINRDEAWVFYDPNLSPTDSNREITGKVCVSSNLARAPATPAAQGR